MKIPETWLYEWVEPVGSLSEIAHQLTMAGLEIEQIEPVAQPFEGVIVAEVLSVEPHPNADRLKVCKVNVGQTEALQIVCGAPNVREGIKVPCAQVGAVLPGDFHIKLSKIRDVQSSGMLCSAQELGMESDVDGLLILPENAPVGVSIRHYLQLDEHILTLKITPNRGDCLSIQGIAREVAAICSTSLKILPINQVESSIGIERKITIANDAATFCPLYHARVFENINPDTKTPDWMARKLTRAGLRSIHPVVDITNYVMLEMGQPLHAFDLDELSGDIHIRLGKTGEKLVLLDDREVDCENLLVISDNTKVLALGGVMGGLQSGVTEKSSRILLEAAFFAPAIVAKAARSLKVDSDSAYRYERGVDFGQTLVAMNRAAQLIIDICQAKAGPVSIAKHPLPVKGPITLHLNRLTRILGMAFSADQVASIFDRLGFVYEIEKDENFVVQVPTCRFDITMEVDLIEEVARIYGYDNILVPPPVGRLMMIAANEARRATDDIKTQMVAMGYLEAINFSFIDADIENTIFENDQPVEILNPIASNLAVMRSSLMGSLLLDLSNNVSRKQNRVRLFEVGRCFFKDNSGNTEVEGVRQPLKVAGLIYGSVYPEQWGVGDRIADFFDIKGDVERLLAQLPVQFKPVCHPALHPGRSAGIYLNDSIIGVVGELHPKWQQKYRFSQVPQLFEIDYESIAQKQIPEFKALSKFQPVFRDLAFTVKDSVTADQLLNCLKGVSLDMLAQFVLFDRYVGPGVTDGFKSLAYRIVFMAEETLTEEKIDLAISQLIQTAKTQYDAQLRS